MPLINNCNLFYLRSNNQPPSNLPQQLLQSGFAFSQLQANIIRIIPISLIYILWGRTVYCKKMVTIRKIFLEEFLSLITSPSEPYFGQLILLLKIKPSFIFFFLLFCVSGSSLPPFIIRRISHTARRCSHSPCLIEFFLNESLLLCAQCMIQISSYKFGSISHVAQSRLFPLNFAPLVARRAVGPQLCGLSIRKIFSRTPGLLDSTPS